MREGAPIASALAAKKRFPGLLAMFARLGEQTGELPLMLQRAAQQLGSEVLKLAMAQREIERQSLRFSEIARLAPVGLFETGADGRLSFSNARAAVLLGLDTQAFLGQPWTALLAAAGHEVDAAAAAQQRPAFECALDRGQGPTWLRVEATQGMALPTADLQATLEFEPLQWVFLITGKPPFELVAGHARSTPSAINSAVLASAMTAKLEDLPSASIASVRLQTASAGDSNIQRWLPAGTEQRSVALWAVLLVGVLVLGGVAYTLLRQLSAKPTPAQPGDGTPGA